VEEGRREGTREGEKRARITACRSSEKQKFIHEEEGGRRGGKTAWNAAERKEQNFIVEKRGKMTL